ncbi:MAG TPA: DJ-1/PfpI family protein [Frateuria sp.]|uniref:DJ-1/PfpI family protein n=1 Tax=Frateuria sp. TaxID=2211372 RepID=UPI002D80BECD|nr:DJ-1/PfpI family protein [Frateuria sp.]HET6805013.1 DJ-1/PfpI family protein [Frateuria sp.]
MKHPLRLAALALLPALALAGPAPTDAPPHPGMIKVAFAISRHVNVMDIAGPWEVFADTSVKGVDGAEVAPYTLYTVSSDTRPLASAGGKQARLTLTPDYDFDHAPVPDIVVVPAQMGGPELEAWLKRIHARHITVMSVCTGAFELARAGLLDGKRATTHHWYFGNLTRDFPAVTLVKQVRYVQADPTTFTAGGLTSGVDLALHLVDQRFGRDVAQQTADFMEYLGTGWKTNAGISPLALPVTRQDWSGRLDGRTEVVLHQVTYGASPTFTFDIPSEHIADAPASLVGKGKEAQLSIALPGHAATFAGHMATDGKSVTGTFRRDGHSQALTLTQQRAAD